LRGVDAVSRPCRDIARGPARHRAGLAYAPGGGSAFLETTLTMRPNAARILALLVVASALAGCDKCADNFIANPFATKPPATCPSGAVPTQK